MRNDKNIVNELLTRVLKIFKPIMHALVSDFVRSGSESGRYYFQRNDRINGFGCQCVFGFVTILFRSLRKVWIFSIANCFGIFDKFSVK